MAGSGEHGEVKIVEIQRWITRLEHRLHRMCSNLEEVKVMLRRILKYPQRSSSMVESLNSRLRVMQTTHRQVTDEMLALRALAWNLTPRRHANRRGHRSPYEMLGVDIGQGHRPWYEVLLEEERRKK